MKEIIEQMRQHKPCKAYELLAPIISDDNKEAQQLWLELFRHRENLFLLQDYFEEIQQEAEVGNPWFQFALARLSHVVRADSQWQQVALDNYVAAAEAGIKDALYYQGSAWREGDFGMVDKERYIHMRDEAADAGSHSAVQQRLRDILFGNNGYKKDPHRVFDLLDKYLTDAEKVGDHIDPKYYHILADAAKATGRNAVADQCYERALENGDVSAWYWLTMLRAGDDDCNISDRDLFAEMVDQGNDILAPESFVALVLMANEEDYPDYPEELQKDLTEDMKRDLEYAYELGEDLGAYFLADNYRFGKYGFEQDNAEAWKWYARAAIYDNVQAYLCMIEMIQDGDAPEGNGEAFMHECELRALRGGEDDMLDAVVNAYKHGFFTEIAAEIEKYYIPRYEAKYADDDDEEPDGRYDAWV